MYENERIMKNNVISIKNKLEKWRNVYTSPDTKFSVSASSMGNLKIQFMRKEQAIHLDFFESVRFMSDVSKGFEEMTLDTIDAL